MIDVLVVVNDQPCGSERPYNARRLANALSKRDDVELRVLLLRDVASATAGQQLPEGRREPPTPPRRARPFESWDDLQLLADRLRRQLGPLVLFAAATGLRPSEWLGLELRDLDREAGVLYVRRAYRNGRIKHPKTAASYRAIPLHRPPRQLQPQPRAHGGCEIDAQEGFTPHRRPENPALSRHYARAL